MRRTILIIFLALAIVPVIFGAATYKSTFIFFDETPGEADPIGSLTFIHGKFKSDTLGLVILRMGDVAKGYFGDGTEKWSWLPFSIATPLNPTSIDSIDFQGDGLLNDVAYISGLKKVTIRKGEKESDADTLWERTFNENIHSIAATDYDGNGFADDLIVAAGQTIYFINPLTEQTFNFFKISDTPYIIASADLDSDGLKDDVVVGSWREIPGSGSLPEAINGNVKGFASNGNSLWTFEPDNTETIVNYLRAFDRDSDGKEDDIIVIFKEIKEDSFESDLYVVSAGAEIFTKADTVGASPADFDGDGRLDDFFLITKSQIFAFNSKTPPIFIESDSLSDLNTSGSRTPREFLRVTSYSNQPEDGEEVFNDAAIFAALSDKERVIFFAENLATEELITTTTTTVTTTTTTLPPQAPTARITGITDGTTVQEDSTIALSAAASIDPDGEIVSYQWLLDDVLRETGRDFDMNTKGLSSGAHIITLKVADNDGEVGVTSITISLAKENVPPIAEAGDDLTIKEGATTTLTGDASTDPDGDIESYEWSEDGTVFSLEKDVEKTFPLGEHTITLRVTDDMGAFSTDTIKIIVEKENIPPNADAGEDITVSEGISVHFSAEDSNDPDGNITSYVWLMPNNNVVRKPSFNASFPAGRYTIFLNVTDDRGSVDSDEIMVTVEKLPGTFERIRKEYSTTIQIGILTFLALISSVLLFLRTRSKGFY
jgi:hypothetical protein